jgi:hypothetical protein
MRILPKLLLCSVIAASACGSPPAARKVPAAPKEPPAVALGELSFNDATVAAKFRRFDAAAKALTKPQWTIRPYRNSTYSGGPARFVGEWCQRTNRRGEGDYSLQAARPNHCIGLIGKSNSPDETIDGLELRAIYLPAKGWGAEIEYRTYNDAALLGEFFNLRFHHDEFNPKNNYDNECALNLVNSYFTARRKYGQLEYQFQVSTHGTRSWMGETKTGPDEQVEKYLASAESFRDAALAELDALERHCRDQIASGEAVIGVNDYTDVRSDNPPRSPPSGVDTCLSEAQKAEVLQSALTEIDRRREIVREHYAEQYAALKATFPLLECLKGS